MTDKAPKLAPAEKQIKQQLLDLKSQLLMQEQADRDAEKPVELDQTRVGRLSRMDAMQAQQMLQEISRRRQAKLRGIDGALIRIESGDYGDCFICGNAIDPQRLAIDPTNTRCIGCVDE